MAMLDGKVIVIGGVGDGIGRSLAVRAAAQGASVIMMARTAARLDRIAAEVADAGGTAIAVPGDLNRLEDCKAVAQTAMARFGRIDGVAMIACMEPDRKLFAEADDDFANWRAIVDMNLWGTLQLVKQCLRGMSSGGAVAIVGSQAAQAPTAYVTAYAAAKAGLAAAVRCLAIENGGKHGNTGIRFNMLSAGGIANEPFFQYVHELAAFAGRTHDEQWRHMVQEYPLGYIPRPDEYADALMFLLSDMAGAVNGLDIHANGGTFMKA